MPWRIATTEELWHNGLPYTLLLSTGASELCLQTLPYPTSQVSRTRTRQAGLNVDVEM
jgi:hypothetical protein